MNEDNNCKSCFDLFKTLQLFTYFSLPMFLRQKKQIFKRTKLKMAHQQRNLAISWGKSGKGQSVPN